MENLEEIVRVSNTYKDVMDYLGWNVNGTNYSKLKKKIEEEDLSVEHFLTSSEFMTIYNMDRVLIPMSEILVKDSKYSNRFSLKRRLYNEGLKERKCELVTDGVLCGQGEEWKGNKMSLILDHINGVNNDNRLENLRMVCPNCNATLSTHGGGNVKNKKNVKTRKQLPLDFHVKKNEKLRIVKRPEYSVLVEDIKDLGYSGTGRKYGVSDNSIRKWVKAYVKSL